MKYLCLILSVVAAQRSWRVERSRLATILFGMDFANENTGIVAGALDGFGPIVFKTTNGGATYERMVFEGQPFPAVGSFLSVSMFSTTSAVAGGICGWCFERTGLEYTLDGQSLQLANDPAPLWPPVAAFQGVAKVPRVRDAIFGFAGNVGDDQVVTVSKDGGRTWQRSRIPPSHRLNARYISMPSTSTWYVTRARWPTQNRAENGFSEISDMVASSFNNVTSGVKVLFQREPSAVQGRYNTSVMKTVDGGATWNTQFELVFGDFYLQQIDCTDENNCWAIGEGRGRAPVGLRTNDGGGTWTQFDTIPSDPTANVVAFAIRFNPANPREGFICGGFLSIVNFSGWFLHTTDGGLTWSRTNIPNVIPVTLSLYTTATGELGGHGTALTIDGQASTIVYR
jgi:photosystem II stability/assembly factor-like uncharacterized protein